MIARLVVQSAMYGEIYYSSWIFDLAMAVLVVVVALPLTVSPAVRNLYAGVQLFASATTVTAAVPNVGQPVQPSRRALEAADPRTPAAVLFAIASSSPELRPAIAANPSTYDDLVTWLEALGDPAVDAALDRRTAGQFGLVGHEPDPEPATEMFISSAPESRSSGAPVHSAEPQLAVPQLAVPQPNPGYVPTGVPLLPGGFRPAGTGIRVAARFIDFAILGVVSVVGGMISTATLGSAFDFDAYRTSSGLIGLLIGIG
ncbi:hypothetical protein ACF1DY_36070, partial [Streptomyces albus]